MNTYKAMSLRALKATLRNYLASTTGRAMWWQSANPDLLRELREEIARRETGKK